MESVKFEELGLYPQLLRAIKEMGFEEATPIQAQAIPVVMSGVDVIGQAQTGTGKTASFGIPLLMKVDPNNKKTQAIVLSPTRELAIQSAEEIRKLAKYMHGIKVLPVYGGQDIGRQIKALKGGATIIIGTPGRIMDHLRRKTIRCDHVNTIVLDEADEMLRMGFIDDVETVMAELPEEHQTALFSATMPEPIRRITKRFMNNPQEVKIKVNNDNAPDIEQNCWYVQGFRKNEALLRFLEVEEFDAAIIFTRTKTGTLDVTELLEKHGFRAAALNGDMTQQLREQTLDRLRNGSLDIVVATDVAARGIDIERISLVVNYDIPLDAESYVHRIGRTGRAGRSGRALLFVEPRERRLLRNIEHLMKKPINEVELPNHEVLQACRRKKFQDKITKQLEHHDLEMYRSLLEDLFTADQDQEDIAAAMLMLLQGKQKLILPPDPPMDKRRRDRNDRGDRRENPRSAERRGERKGYGTPQPMDLYRIEVGRADGVEVRHIVGAIANEGDINSRYIGHIKLYDDYSTVELPQGMPKELLQQFGKTRVLNKQMQMSFMGAAQSDNRRGGNDFDGKGRRNERGDRGQDRFRGERNGERRQRKFNDKNDRTFNERGRRDRQR